MRLDEVKKLLDPVYAALSAEEKALVYCVVAREQTLEVTWVLGKIPSTDVERQVRAKLERLRYPRAGYWPLPCWSVQFFGREIEERWARNSERFKDSKKRTLKALRVINEATRAESPPSIFK